MKNFHRQILIFRNLVEKKMKLKRTTHLSVNMMLVYTSLFQRVLLNWWCIPKIYSHCFLMVTRLVEFLIWKFKEFWKIVKIHIAMKNRPVFSLLLICGVMRSSHLQLYDIRNTAYKPAMSKRRLKFFLTNLPFGDITTRNISKQDDKNNRSVDSIFCWLSDILYYKWKRYHRRNIITFLLTFGTIFAERTCQA